MWEVKIGCEIPVTLARTGLTLAIHTVVRRVYQRCLDQPQSKYQSVSKQTFFLDTTERKPLSFARVSLKYEKKSTNDHLTNHGLKTPTYLVK